MVLLVQEWQQTQFLVHCDLSEYCTAKPKNPTTLIRIQAGYYTTKQQMSPIQRTAEVNCRTNASW
jgi:hypothetical protein